jgi:hypothetical protein
MSADDLETRARKARALLEAQPWPETPGPLVPVEVAIDAILAAFTEPAAAMPAQSLEGVDLLSAITDAMHAAGKMDKALARAIRDEIGSAILKKAMRRAEALGHDGPVRRAVKELSPSHSGETGEALERLREALGKCADKFDFYEQCHRLKCTADGDEKADRNREMADMCRDALKATPNDGGRDDASNEQREEG